MNYTHRTIEPVFQEYLQTFPVVAVTGPRQSGKSTLLKQCLSGIYKYITFDSQEVCDDFYSDPNRFMQQYSNNIIFDEVQKVPEIFNYIKIAVDNDRDNYGKYVVTGSSQFNMVQAITESLAGRIGLLNLLPFQFTELPESLRDIAIYKGCYPELVNRQYKGSRAWYDSYISTYLEKDIRQLINIGDARDFSRLLQLLAANTTEMFNMSTYAHDLGVTVSTIKRWVSVLEASYIIFLLSPFYNNQGKRLIKSPKIYFYDTGLAAYLVRSDNKEQFDNGPMRGKLFENYIITQIKKNIVHQKIRADLYYYRTSNKVEIDCIIDYMDYKNLIEIKSSNTFKPKMLEPIKSLLTANDKGFLVYGGLNREYNDNISIINYQDYLLKSV